ncbi:MAG: twin-arginine translocase TatA/TatE family subunit [Acidobacteria bacterium]|nr:twin-arginine translocase TatA/TatE family subunit [Acidobacteriota bacterium]
MFGTIGMPELLVILFILLLLFGAAKLPQLGSALGKTIKNFKQQVREGEKEALNQKCPKCEGEIKEDFEICPKCGEKLK